MCLQEQKNTGKDHE